MLSSRMRKILDFEKILDSNEDTRANLSHTEIQLWQLCISCLNNDTEDCSKMFVMDGELLNVQDMVCSITGMKEDFVDKLPKKICKECLSKLKELYRFKFQIKRACNVLDQLIELTDENGEEEFIDTHSFSSEKSFELEDVSTIYEESISNKEDYDETETLFLDEHQLNDISYDNSENNPNDESHLPNIEYSEESCVNIDNDTILVDTAETFNCNITASDENEYLLCITRNSTPIVCDDKESSCVIDSKMKFKRDNPSTTKSVGKKRRLSNALLESLTCEICGRMFELQRDLVKHVHQNHPTSKAFKCRECGFKFAHIQSLSRHMHIHKATDFKNICSICYRAFQRYEDLKRHERIHTGERPYSCDLCEKSFKQTNELKEHQRTHVNNKTFECNICERKLKSRNGLYMHKKIHKDIKSYNT